MRLNKDSMMDLAYEQANNYNVNNKKSGQAFYDDDNEVLVIINDGKEFNFEVGQDMDVRDAKEVGIYDAFITVSHTMEED